MNFSDQLKQQVDIVDVIGQYVRLKRMGNNRRFVGLCPFHSEKSPSFNVDGVGQYFKCFGCDFGGDVFTFVMTHERLTFPEVLRVLAGRYGIPMPERERLDDPEAKVRATLMEMHEIAAEIFQQNLSGPQGQEALAYLRHRGVTDDSIREFRLGLSDASGQQLVNRLRNFGSAALQASGLVLKRQEGGGFYDRFRGRLMFPIHNESGKVIAFGGRALRSGDEPKYLNSNETPIYKKSAVLYNLHRAKLEARKNDRMILVEGYMDVVGVYSAGIHEVVASSGTALSSEQVRTIKRQVSLTQANKGTIVLCFDPDEAGIRSTEKYIQLLLSEGLRVRVLKVPGGLDPDEYIQQNGAEAFSRLLDHAETYFHWLADRARTKFDMHTAEGRMDAFQFMKPALQLVQDRLERGAIAAELAEYLNVDREVIRDTFRPNSNPATRAAAVSLSSDLPPNEKILLSCLLISADARGAVRQYLEHSDILSFLELRAIVEAILASEESQGVSTEDVLKRLNDRDGKLFLEMSFAHHGQTEEAAPQQALHCIEALEASALLKRREILKRQIRQAEASGDLPAALRLAEQLRDLQ